MIYLEAGDCGAACGCAVLPDMWGFDPEGIMLIMEFRIELYGGGAGVAAGLAVFTVPRQKKNISWLQNTIE